MKFEQSAIPRFLTVREVAERLRLSRSKVYELINLRQLRSVVIGRCRRVPEQAVLDFLADVGLEGAAHE